MSRSLTLIAFLTIAANARGDKFTTPSSYCIVAPGGQFVFVMLAPESLEADLSQRPEPEATRIRGIRTKWPTSGMYRNDGSATPLWTAEWNDWLFGDVVVAPDGTHVANICRIAKKPTTEVIRFYAEGIPIRAYKLDELVAFPAWLKQSSSGYWWLKETRPSGDSLHLEVETEHGDKYVFDLRSGGEVSSFRPFRIAATTVCIFGGLLLGVVIYRAWRRRKKLSEG